MCIRDRILLDLSSLWRPVAGADVAQNRARLARMSTNLGAFTLGCGTAGLLYLTVGMWCMLLPPLVAAAEIFTLGPDKSAVGVG